MEVDTEGHSSNDFITFPSLPTLHDNPDWEYTMRRTMQEIIPNLYLGPYSSACRSQLDVLQSTGITHIICIRHPVEVNRVKPNFPDLFSYLVLDVRDDQDEQIMKFFPVIKDFIHGCMTNNGKVLIHGNGGISRSAALVIAYLMETYGLTYTRAYNYVQQKRFCINPNEAFVRQLMEYEPIYLAKHQLNMTSRDQNRETSKRTFDDSDDESTAGIFQQFKSPTKRVHDFYDH